MGKLIISNNKKIIEKLSKTFLNVGFSENRKYNLPPYITTFYKLNVKNDNVYCQDDFFVIVNGTAIYKNQFGYKALKFLLDDYRQLIKKYSNEEVIRKLREKLIGNYVVVIGSVKSSCCFVDETGSYAFYYSSGSDFLATQTFYHVAKNSSNKINKYAVFEKMIRGNMSAKDTYFDGVTRLLADEILELHFENNGLVVRTVKCNLNDYTCTVIDENEYIEKLKTEIEHLAMMRHALLNNSKTLMFVTGGLDSRLELSLHLKFKEEVILGYWAGNDIITNGTKEDLEISQKIAVAINAPFKFFDVSESFEECVSSAKPELFDKYGEYASVYGNNRKWLEIPELMGEEISAIGFGYFGETVRELEALDNSYFDGYTLNDFIKNIYCRNGVDKCILTDNNIYSYLETQLKRIGSGITSHEFMTKEDVLNLFNRTRFHSDTICNNYINMFCYGFSILSQKRIVDILEHMPYYMKTNAKLTLHLIKEWAPGLVDIPYFTHHHFVVYDKKHNCVREKINNQIINSVRTTVKKTPIYDAVLPIAHLLKEKKRGLSNSNKVLLVQTNKFVKETEFYNTNKSSIIIPDSNLNYDICSYAESVIDMKMIDSITIKSLNRSRK